MEKIVGVFANDSDLLSSREELTAVGFQNAAIKVSREPSQVWQWLDGKKRLRRLLKSAGYGAAIGIVVGGLYGIPAGIANCTIGACSVATSLKFLVVIEAYWMLAGGFLGAIAGLDRLERALFAYVEGARKGESVLVVESPPEKSTQVMEIMRQNHSTAVQDIHEEDS